ARAVRVVDDPVGDDVHPVGAGVAHGGRHAGGAGIVGVEVRVQAGILGGLDHEGEVGAPVAGDDGVGAGRLDLADVGREVTHLGQRMEVLADDLDVRALALEILFRGLL